MYDIPAAEVAREGASLNILASSSLVYVLPSTNNPFSKL